MTDSLWITDFREGQRVELHPATDAWMAGDRYGMVESIGLKLVHIRMDRTNKLRRVHPTHILRIMPT